MKHVFSPENSLDFLAAVLAGIAFLAVLHTFIIGQHFVIPTLILALAVTFGNLARFGLRGARWAKQILFWLFAIAASHAFFALFWAKTPRELLGGAFYYVYGAAFAVLTLLCWQYAKKNEFFN